MLLTIENDNFINANEIVLFNGFIKKSTADYDQQITIDKNARVLKSVCEILQVFTLLNLQNLYHLKLPEHVKKSRNQFLKHYDFADYFNIML